MTPGPVGSAPDELDRLDDVARQFDESAREARSAARRVRRLRRERATGRRWHELVDHRRLEALGLIDRSVRRVTEGSAAFRRMLVRGLWREGATVQAIARHLGVSRQRVSALLERGSDGPVPEPAD